MKIVVIAPLPPPVTGQSIAVQTLVESLKGREHVEVIDSKKKGFQQGVGSLGRVSDIATILMEVWRIRRSAEVIYFNVSQSIAGNLKDLLIYIICWNRLNRVVVHLHGGAGMRELLSSKHPLLRVVNSFFLRRLGAVIVLGDRLKSIYKDVVPQARLYAVPNFFKDDLFVSPSDIDEKFACVEPLRLLFLSNLLPGKGHEELLTALSVLPVDVRQHLHVDFAGGFESPEEEARFRKQAQAIKSVQINVLGIVHGEQKRDLLRKAHLFCLPTYYPYEGQPISILEAYASGCAVMTTDHSGIFDTFTPGVNGIEVKPRSPESIALAIQHAMTHTQELCVYAKNNHSQAQQKYRTSTHLEALEKIIFSVAQ